MAEPYIAHLTRQVAAVKVTGRWTPGRKACLLELIRRGVLTPDQARARYRISADELASWQRRVGAHGQAGLSIRHLQELRA
jgi:hypothetical protein